MNILLLFCLFLFGFGDRGLAQQPSNELHASNIQKILEFIESNSGTFDCSMSSLDIEKQYFCEKALLASNQHVATSSAIRKEGTTFSAMAKHQFTPYIILILSDVLLGVSDAMSIERLSLLDDLVVSNRHVLVRYLKSDEQYRRAHFKQNHRVNTLLKKAFTTIDVTGEAKPKIKYTWVGAKGTLSNEISVATFQDLLADMSRTTSKQYSQYLDDFHLHGRNFILSATEETFKKKLGYYSHITTRMTRARNLKIAGYTSGIVGLSLFIWQYTHENALHEEAPIPITSSDLALMVEHDLPMLQMYVLEPSAKTTSLLSSTIDEIPVAMLEYQKILNSLPLSN
jgi:hypothetical protein